MSPSHEVQSFRNRLLQRGSPTGSQVLSANLLQLGLLSLCRSTGPARSLLQPPSGIHLLWRGVFHKLQVDVCSTVDLRGLQGTACLTVIIMGCRGISAPAPGAPHPPPSALTLVSAELFLTFFSLLSPTAVAVALGFFPLLKYVMTEALPLSLMGLALASGGSLLETAGIGSVRHRGSF